MSDVSVIGIGLMGSAIAAALLKGGKTVTVWNRSPEKAEALRGSGAEIAPTAAAAVAASPLSVIVLPSYDIVRETLDGVGPELRGHVVVNLTTGQPNQAAELESWLSVRGARLLDGCILEYPSEIGDPAGKIKYGGPAQLWDEHRDLLTILGGASELVDEDIRAGNVVDVAVLTFYIASCAAVIEAAALGAAYGLDYATLEPHFRSVLSPNLEWLIKNTGEKIAADDYTNEQATVDVYLAAAQGIVGSMDVVGLRGRLTEATRDSLRLAQDAGSGAKDFASIYPELVASRRPGREA
jgi:3-hydroxyisobutyrate dehydrogenase-like beta-hydroxyacid dehydrogenase